MSIRYNGVYSAFRFATVTTAITLMELQVPANVQIDLIRAWCSPATNLIDDVQEIELYVNDAVGTGTSASENKLQGVVDATSSVVALERVTEGATPTVILQDAFHLQNGWVYLPVEEERIRIAGGSAADNIGMRLFVAPDVSTDLAWGMVWGELG